MRFQTAHTPNSLTEGPIAQTLIAFALPLFLGNLFAQHLVHKTLLACLAWIVFSVLLLVFYLFTFITHT